MSLTGKSGEFVDPSGPILLDPGFSCGVPFFIVSLLLCYWLLGVLWTLRPSTAK